MVLTVYLHGIQIATLRFQSRGAAWLLVSRELVGEETPQSKAAIEQAVHSAKTDVFQPSGRRVQINAVEYVAVPLQAAG